MPSDPNSIPPQPKPEPAADAADRGGGAAAPPLPAVLTLPVIALPVFLTPPGLEPLAFMGQYAMTHQAVLATVTAQAQIQMQMQNIYPPASELVSSTFSQSGLSTPNPVQLKRRPASVPEAKNRVPLKRRPSSVPEVMCPEPLQQHPSSVPEVKCPEPLQQRPSSVSEVESPEPLQQQPSPVPEVKSPKPLQQRPSPVPEVESPEPSPVPEVKSPKPLQQRPSSIPEGSAVDAYHWRKYGQKHIKSSDNSRSYYRCTDSNCLAKKKVERCPDGTIVDITYEGKHTHDPPRKYRYTQDKGQQTSGASGECGILEQNSCSGTPEQHLHCSSDAEVNAGTKKEDDVAQESDAKRRHTESPTFSMPVQKTVREYIVQTEIDARHLSDGYRWRKYGQKFVKGNPNPRSYYRCTHEGCPVRKHVERASHDAKALLITYDGKHNHDQPASKYTSDSAARTPKADIAVIAGEKLNTSSSSLDNKVLEVSHAEKIVEKEAADEKPQVVQNNKALESAQAPVSVGWKSSSHEDSDRTNDDNVKNPLFNESKAAVPIQNS